MYITTKRTDGFGSQFQNIISAIIYSDLNNLTYIHRPIEQIEHNYDNDPDFIKRINDFMNIDKKYPRYDDFFKQNPDLLNKQLNLINYKKFFDKDFNSFYNSNSLKNIKLNYFSNKEPKSSFFNDILSITVHLRRPNSHDSRDCPDFDSIYLKLMNQISDKYNKLNIKHHFYIESQGNSDDFSLFTSKFKNLTLNLNGLPEISFHRMVISDILVTATSSFSYTAALLSDGIIYYKNFWHPGSDNWIHF